MTNDSVTPQTNQSLDDQLHLENQQSSGTKANEHKCLYCDKTFTTKSKFIEHEKIHLRPFHCTHCDKQFPKKAYLVQHERIHTGVKPYNCPHCDTRFKRSSHLVQHQSVHLDIFPFSCPHCDI